VAGGFDLLSVSLNRSLGEWDNRFTLPNSRVAAMPTVRLSRAGDGISVVHHYEK